MHRVIVKNLDSYLVTQAKLVHVFHQHGFVGLQRSGILISRKGACEPGKMCTAFVTLSSEDEVRGASRSLTGKFYPALSTKALMVEKAVPRMSQYATLSSDTPAVVDPYILGPLDDPAEAASSDPHLKISESLKAGSPAETEVHAESSERSKVVLRSRSARRKRRRSRKTSSLSSTSDARPGATPKPNPWRRRQMLRGLEDDS